MLNANKSHHPADHVADGITKDMPSRRNRSRGYITAEFRGVTLTFSDDGSLSQAQHNWLLREWILNDGKSVDWDYWLSLKKWSALEAACLSQGVCPDFWGNPNKGRAYMPNAKSETEFEIVHGVIRRLERMDSNLRPPQGWIAMLSDMGCEISPRMIELIDKCATSVGNVSMKDERINELSEVVDEIEARAKDEGISFKRSEWPGTKAEFIQLCAWTSRILTRLPESTDGLDVYLKSVGIRFSPPGRSKDKGIRFYRSVYPDYPY